MVELKASLFESYGIFFSFFIIIIIIFIVVDFVIHWNETAMGLHVFPIPIPPSHPPLHPIRLIRLDAWDKHSDLVHWEDLEESGNICQFLWYEYSQCICLQSTNGLTASSQNSAMSQLPQTSSTINNTMCSFEEYF